MKTLQSGDCVRADNFRKAFPVMTLADYAKESGLDFATEYNRAINRGHDIAWSLNSGSMITDSKAFNDAQITLWRERRAKAITLAHGETVKIGADLFTVRINGENFADPIAFKLIRQLAS